MLRVPDRRERNLLDLANFIETVNPEHFNMRCWGGCICGHYMRSLGREDVGNYFVAGRELGLTDEQARELFCVDQNPADAPHMMDTPKQAAERIRKFAFALVPAC